MRSRCASRAQASAVKLSSAEGLRMSEEVTHAFYMKSVESNVFFFQKEDVYSEQNGFPTSRRTLALIRKMVIFFCIAVC